MAYVPPEPEWFLAELVMEHRVEGDPRNVVHFNTVLVEAGSPEEAWVKAQELGRLGEHTYRNTDEREVTLRFRGLRDLVPVYEDLEHGAELLFQERIGVPEEQLQAMIPPRHDLSVFEPPLESEELAPPAHPREEPNLVPRDVVDLLEGREVEGAGALESVEPSTPPSGESLRFARHAALVAAAELRRRGMTEQAKGAEYLAEALEHLIPTR